MLGDADQRVIPAVLASLARSAPARCGERDAGSAEGTTIRWSAPLRRATCRAEADRALAASLAEAYRSGQRDPTYVARAAALAALAELPRADAAPVLERALADKDWAVRVRAAALLKQHRSRERRGACGSGRRRHAVRRPSRRRADQADGVDRRRYRDRSRDDSDRARGPRRAAHRRELRDAGPQGFFNGLTFHRVVPDFVDPGRRSARRWRRWAGLHDSRRAEPAAISARHRWAWRSTGRTPAAASSSSRTRRSRTSTRVHGLRSRDRGDGGRRSD